jgi:3-oxoacyl-ACP reductase-like protein
LADTTTTINLPGVAERLASAMKEIENQEKALYDVTGVVRFMDDAWDSEAQDAHEAKYMATRDEIIKFNASMKDYLRFMSQYVEDCGAADGSLAAALGAIGGLVSRVM